ncbi:MAG TPA: hypothetical protein EYP23_04335 [Thermoplasmata archaeon]|nr:hypothetical protein [Thermoplasmata archaeon]
MDELNIAFPGDKPQTFFATPILVAGRWQYVNVTLNESVDELTISLYKGDTVPQPSVRDETNYYAWQYTAPDNWFPLHDYGIDDYLNESTCSRSGNTYSFCIGVSQDAVGGYEWINWTLEITSGGEEVFSQAVVIEKPETGIESKTGTLIFHVEPFTVTNLSSSFGIHNIGNTPVEITRVSYNKLSDRISTSNIGAVLGVDGSSKHDVTVVTKEWPPGRVIVEGTTTASSLYWFPYMGIMYAPSVQVSIPQIYIYVGHSDYELEEMGNGRITFQYERNIEMSYGEIRNVTAYICGNGNITVSLSSTNLSILRVWYDEELIADPTFFSVRSTNTSEHVLTVQISAEKPNVTGYIVYTIMVNEHPYSYVTTVEVNASVSTGQQKGDNVNVATAVLIASVTLLTIFYILYSRMKYRKK